MARLILLDSGPLGLIVRAPGPAGRKSGVVSAGCRPSGQAGAIVIIPEIAHYEVRRELHRIRAVGSLRRLDDPDRTDIDAVNLDCVVGILTQTGKAGQLRYWR